MEVGECLRLGNSVSVLFNTVKDWLQALNCLSLSKADQFTLSQEYAQGKSSLETFSLKEVRSLLALVFYQGTQKQEGN